MKKYLYNYIKEIDLLIMGGDITELDITHHLKKISFFQHERLIHLIVTVFYALFTLLAFIITILSPMFIFVGLILMAFLIPYVLHYFHLENGTQYLYKQYDEMLKLLAIKKGKIKL